MAKELVDSPDAIARFSREAAAASQVKSPHVVQMLDHGCVEGGAPYHRVMELLEGQDLEHHIRAAGGKLPARSRRRVVLQLGRALGKAHERGIVHRDIKPSNVFLLDAGGDEVFSEAARLRDRQGHGARHPGEHDAVGHLPAFVGSPCYMSPEQIVGARDVDFRSDLWSLGVLAFEALTGTKPFVAETLGALALKIHRDALPMPTTLHPELPAALDVWFTKACAREPGERFASAREMAEALGAALLGEGATSSSLSDSGGKPPGSTRKRQEGGAKAQEPHGLAATLRSDDPTGSGPFASRAPLAGIAKWLAVAVVVGVGALILARALAGDGKKTAASVQGATLAEPAAESPFLRLRPPARCRLR